MIEESYCDVLKFHAKFSSSRVTKFYLRVIVFGTNVDLCSSVPLTDKTWKHCRSLLLTKEHRGKFSFNELNKQLYFHWVIILLSNNFSLLCKTSPNFLLVFETKFIN